MRISDWSSDVCSSDLELRGLVAQHEARLVARGQVEFLRDRVHHHHDDHVEQIRHGFEALEFEHYKFIVADRSEEHTSELQSLMRISYAVFCLKKKTLTKENTN